MSKIPKRRGRPPKHGAYSETALIPLQESKMKLIEDILLGEKSIMSPVDNIAKELLARNLAKVDLIDRYLAERGLFVSLAEGKPQPILKIYWMALNSAARLCEQLGLTPTARARLGLKVAQAVDLASQIHEAKQRAAIEESSGT